MQRLVKLLLAAAFTIQAVVCMAEPAGDPKTDALFAALGMPELLQIMRLEGLDHGAAIARQALGDARNTGWGGTMSVIYDTGFMT